VATILELPLDQLPLPGAGEDPLAGGLITRWLGRFGLSLARVADAASFAWPGPWIARIAASDGAAAGGREPGGHRFVVMFGVPSGIVWDPARPGDAAPGRPLDGFLIAPADVALALPPPAEAPSDTGTIVAIGVASSAGQPVQLLESVRAIPGQGLAGDRHTLGTGTFPSGMPGSALTLIASEVCESFDPPLGPDEHRRNLTTRGIDLNRLVGRPFTVGEVQCRGMRLCEPCTVVQRYAGRPVLRALAHRGGLRADILTDGLIRVGDPVRALPDPPPPPTATARSRSLPRR
jgi:MOSC domain-containing protein YiiM